MKLAILFPGIGYHTDKPLLYYSKKILKNMDYEIKEIASYLSFCSQSYFGNIFRQQTGMTPARYRKKYGKWKEQK